MDGLPMDKLNMGGMNGMDGQKEKPAPEKPRYDGYVESTYLSCDGTLIIDADGLLIDTVFEQDVVAYADVEEISLQGYDVRIRTARDDVTASKMGEKSEWFYRELTDAYNKKVLKALHVEGAPVYETQGEYRITENGRTIQGTAKLHVFEDCLCILPPNKDARRIPFVFINGLKQENFTVALTLVSGESCAFSKLGYDTDGFEKRIAAGIRAMREKAAAAAQELDGTLGISQAAQAAKLMPVGIAAPVETLRSTLLSFLAAIEAKIQESRIAETYSLLGGLGDASRLQIGMKPVPVKEDTLSPPAVGLSPAEGMEAGGAEPAEREQKPPPPILWVIAPGKDLRFAAVELALPDEEAAATYVYRTDGGWDGFLPVLNRALEASDFRREVISRSDEELNEARHENDRMLLERTPALRLLRERFAGRVIHASAESWKKGIMRYMEPEESGETGGGESAAGRFCTNCGARLMDGAKFCGGCGMKRPDANAGNPG